MDKIVAAQPTEVPVMLVQSLLDREDIYVAGPDESYIALPVVP